MSMCRVTAPLTSAFLLSITFVNVLRYDPRVKPGSSHSGSESCEGKNSPKTLKTRVKN